MILQKIKGMPGALFAIIALLFLNFNFHLGKIIDSLQKLQELKIQLFELIVKKINF